MEFIIPELKCWDCTDHDPIEDWVPDTDCILYFLVCHIGLPGELGSDMYTVPIANELGLRSPNWKRCRLDTYASILPEPILVNPYSWEEVMESVLERIASCSAYGWFACQEKLRKKFMWEFEGMGPH